MDGELAVLEAKNALNIRRLGGKETLPMDLLLLADPSREMVMAYANRGECYVAEIEEKVIGVYILLPARPGIVELANVAVAKKHQGKGFGKRLVLDAIRRAGKRGFKTIEVGTGNSSISQLALYQKCGFRISGVDRGFFVRHYAETIYENGIRCRDMVRLSLDLVETTCKG
ncbi:GNAT family N-acetyltransferase [Heyndrickxia coagulans]|uniref:GNAT family N-acetyltransferase n=1 Tax=Heyndrickxia coagulans TaxID=1398 RepID=UPI0002E39658|nr:GNAT family N-acetyltransferase [Heyndrickxia coagulans]MCR2845730.1 GNAT family N-acetyltransferase [Heyndrickxia coagulans]MDR4223258.1 GNAT family N-acetyltransferase [Heyndrickxia coagulans DSM 1 = ATCC 7050]MED4493684.1 GNAT family N-acetyltransferase [Heyndrickxia coagulans]MED4536807.1 GNAT family N-acetyltransferase [Heyndrickxia coagulans]QJE33417.1 GNAT family N-acetyltransferase [Heyndrickxia coagulans]